MKSIFATIAATMVLAACGTSTGSSTKEANLPHPIPERTVFTCVTNFQQDNLSVNFIKNFLTFEYRAEIYGTNKAGDLELIREANVCTTHDEGSALVTFCHDVNFTDTYNVSVHHGQKVGNISFVSETNPFEGQLACESND
jgi:hypothetical protein